MIMIVDTVPIEDATEDQADLADMVDMDVERATVEDTAADMEADMVTATEKEEEAEAEVEVEAIDTHTMALVFIHIIC